MMTQLVTCLGPLPAGMSTGVGSTTQKPFAIVVIGGLFSRLFLGFFVNPVFTKWSPATATFCRSSRKNLWM